jgi:dimethylargininase
VEDTAVVLDELAVISRMGAKSRQPETTSVAEALVRYRPLNFLAEPATLGGGDVLWIGRSIFVGLSQRTNRDGFNQLFELLGAFDYQVQLVEVRNCLRPCANLSAQSTKRTASESGAGLLGQSSNSR